MSGNCTLKNIELDVLAYIWCNLIFLVAKFKILRSFHTLSKLANGTLTNEIMLFVIVRNFYVAFIYQNKTFPYSYNQNNKKFGINDIFDIIT